MYKARTKTRRDLLKLKFSVKYPHLALMPLRLVAAAVAFLASAYALSTCSSSAYFAEQRRTPKPGCEQRRRVAEFQQKHKD